MNKQLSNMLQYLWQVCQILGVTLVIVTMVLLAVSLWKAWGLL